MRIDKQSLSEAIINLKTVQDYSYITVLDKDIEKFNNCLKRIEHEIDILENIQEENYNY